LHLLESRAILEKNGETGLVNKVYKVEDIFEDIEGDKDNVLMNIPPEISEQMGWEPGDDLIITVEEGTIVLMKKQNGKE